jgi:hypothetical protein
MLLYRIVLPLDGIGMRLPERGPSGAVLWTRSFVVHRRPMGKVPLEDSLVIQRWNCNLIIRSISLDCLEDKCVCDTSPIVAIPAS